MVGKPLLGILWIGMSGYQPGLPTAKAKVATAQAVLENKELDLGVEIIRRGVTNGTAPADWAHQIKNHR